MASGQPDYTRQVAVTVIDTPDTINIALPPSTPTLSVSFPSEQNVKITGQTPNVAVDVISMPASSNVAVTSMPTSSGVQIKGQDANLNVAVQSMPTSSGVQIKGQDAALTTTPSLPYIAGRTYSYEDTSFVTGDSPVTLAVNTNLGRNAHDGYIVNDGAGNFTVEISDNGTNYGGAHTMKSGETMKLTHLDINKIRITWVADSAYRVFVV